MGGLHRLLRYTLQFGRQFIQAYFVAGDNGEFSQHLLGVVLAPEETAVDNALNSAAQRGE